MNGPSNKVVIDLGALRHNYTLIRRSLIDPDTKIIAIVKSDAYGHGMVEVAKALESQPALWGFGVAEVWEADRLREHGVHGKILLISGVATEKECERAISKGYVIGITSREEALLVSRVAQRLGKDAHCHLKVDSGMTRFGLTEEEVLSLVQARREVLSGVNLEGLYSHLACADEPYSPFNREQIQDFHRILDGVKALGWMPHLVHLLNSSGIFNFPQEQLDAVRPGIALYGAMDGGRETGPLRQVMRVHTKIRTIRCIPRGAFVGYGSTFRLERDSRLAIIPMGYDDGLMRSLSNRGSVLVRGRRVPIVGRISMRSTVIDVTECPGVDVGDEVVIIGTQGDESMSAVELAASAGTISYELLCLLGTRNPRIFIDAEVDEISP